MLTCFLFIEVIAMNVETKSITLYDSYPMEWIIVDNKRNNSTHWLLTEIHNFYNSIIELYVNISTIYVNLEHVYMRFRNATNTYRYVYNYAWKTMIAFEKKLHALSQKMHILIMDPLRTIKLYAWRIWIDNCHIIQCIYIFFQFYAIFGKQKHLNQFMVLYLFNNIEDKLVYYLIKLFQYIQWYSNIDCICYLMNAFPPFQHI